MKRRILVLGVLAALAVTGCKSGSGDGATPPVVEGENLSDTGSAEEIDVEVDPDYADPYSDEAMAEKKAEQERRESELEASYGVYRPDVSHVRYDEEEGFEYYDNLVRMCADLDCADRIIAELIPGAKIVGYSKKYHEYIIELPDTYDTYEKLSVYCDSVYDAATEKDDEELGLQYYIVTLSPEGVRTYATEILGEDYVPVFPDKVVG